MMKKAVWKAATEKADLLILDIIKKTQNVLQDQTNAKTEAMNVF